MGLSLTNGQKFEGDASLSRTDFFFTGDDHTFNNTLFQQITNLAYIGGDKSSVSNYVFSPSVVAQHQFNRYQDSLNTNPNFFFGPKAIILYGAASFLYEAFPSHGPDGSPTLLDQAAFFGTSNPDANGQVHFANTEHVPVNPNPLGPGWFARTDPYNLTALVEQVVVLYTAHPVLFGGNAGVDNFDAINFGQSISNGKLTTDPAALLCLLYQIATDDVPDSLSSVLNLPSSVLSFMTGKLNPIFANSGCTLANVL